MHAARTTASTLDQVDSDALVVALLALTEYGADDVTLVEIADALDAAEARERQLAEQWVAIAALVADGWSELDAVAAVTGRTVAELEREERLARIDSDRRQGETRDQAVRRAYDAEMGRRFELAETACRGHMLSDDGAQHGIDPRKLFYGPVWRVERFASEELREWFDAHGRITVADWRAQCAVDLRPVSAVPAAPLVAEQAPAVEQVTIDGDAVPFPDAPSVAVRTIPAAPVAPAPVQLGMFAVDTGEMTGQGALLDALCSIGTPAVVDQVAEAPTHPYVAAELGSRMCGECGKGRSAKTHPRRVAGPAALRPVAEAPALVEQVAEVPAPRVTMGARPTSAAFTVGEGRQGAPVKGDGLVFWTVRDGATGAVLASVKVYAPGWRFDTAPLVAAIAEAYGVTGDRVTVKLGRVGGAPRAAAGTVADWSPEAPAELPEVPPVVDQVNVPEAPAELPAEAPEQVAEVAPVAAVDQVAEQAPAAGEPQRTRRAAQHTLPAAPVRPVPAPAADPYWHLPAPGPAPVVRRTGRRRFAELSGGTQVAVMLGAVVFGLPIVWCVLCVLVVCAPAIPALAVVVVRVVKPHGRRRYGSTRADRWR